MLYFRLSFKGSESPSSRLFRSAQQQVHGPVRGCFPGRGNVASQDPELFCSEGFPRPNGMEKNYAATSKEQTDHRSKRTGDAFLTFKGVVQDSDPVHARQRGPPSRPWEKGTSWVTGGLRPARAHRFCRRRGYNPSAAQDSGLKKCRQCPLFSQRLPNFGQEFITIGRFLEEAHRPSVQRTFLIVSRISGAEHDDWSCHKICQASHPFKDQEPVTCR